MEGWDQDGHARVDLRHCSPVGLFMDLATSPNLLVDRLGISANKARVTSRHIPLAKNLGERPA